MRTRLVLVGFTMAGALLAQPASLAAAVGGPDAAGYTWADSDEPGINPGVPGFSGTDLRALGFTGDDPVIRLTLPASVFPTGFPYHGQSYNQLWLSANGWLSFVDPGAELGKTPRNVPNGLAPNATVAFFWDDWTLENLLPVAQAGPNGNNTGYVIFLRVARASNLNLMAQIYVTLYASGVIEVQYSSAVAEIDGPATVIGIENAAGAVGLPYMSSGVPHNGANFRQNYAVVFYPRGNLDCQNNLVNLGCPGQTVNSNNSPPLTNRVSAYQCDTGAWTGNERVLPFTVASVSDVTLTLSNTGIRNMKMFLIRPSCSEATGCLASGAPALSYRYLPPGTYYLVVDSDAAGVGNFTVQLQCTDATTQLPCNTSLTGQSTGGTGVLTNYDCLFNVNGPEEVYRVDFAAPALTLRARLINPASPDMRVLVSNAGGFDFRKPTCVAEGPAQATIYGAPAGPYYVTVDGLNNSAGGFDVAVDCLPPLLQCPVPAKVIDITNPAPVVGDTTALTNRAENYLCQSSAYGPPGEVGAYDGPEDVYEFTVTTPTTASFFLSAPSPDMRLLLLQDCYEGTCISEGGCSESLEPGTYRLVVDGLNGARGPYAITPVIISLPAYNRWYDCPECVGTCTLNEGIAGANAWSFDSMNYCGTGCDFSMFAVVECGSDFHTPFFDVETGHLKIKDVLKGTFVNLQARNDSTMAGCGYQTSGQLVQWEDNTCTAIPCPTAACGGGSDCRTNEVTMDVNFSGQPNICGIYEMQFLNWGGFAWQVYANCDGTTTPQHNIYRDFCAAIANYHPRPELSITRVTVDTSQCASNRLSGTVEVTNLGCGPAAGAEVVITQTGAAPNPQTVLVTVLPSGATSVPWSYTLTDALANLVFNADPGDKVQECSETSSGAVACGVSSPGQHTLNVGACACSAPVTAASQLKAVRSGTGRPDATFSWQPITASRVDAYRLYKDASPLVPSATRRLVGEVAAAVTTLTDRLAVPDPPTPRAFYQMVGVACGNLEGPY